MSKKAALVMSHDHSKPACHHDFVSIQSWHAILRREVDDNDFGSSFAWCGVPTRLDPMMLCC